MFVCFVLRHLRKILSCCLVIFYSCCTLSSFVSFGSGTCRYCKEAGLAKVGEVSELRDQAPVEPCLDTTNA